MGYKPRLSAPSTIDKNWIHTSYGGKNSCIRIAGNSVLPNCVGYAWGRFMEVLGDTPKLSRGNAEDWYRHTSDGYKRGKTPKLGAVICWRKGKAGNGSDGAGHVAIVEKINSDGSIVISQSGYKSSRFWISTIKKGYALAGYVFQGFIYNPAVSESKGGNTVNVSLNVLKKGSTGEQVKTVQRLCYCMCYCPDDFKIDGSFGSITHKYVKKVQSMLGLETDGCVGTLTWNALLK